MGAGTLRQSPQYRDIQDSHLTSSSLVCFPYSKAQLVHYPHKIQSTYVRFVAQLLSMNISKDNETFKESIQDRNTTTHKPKE